MTATPASPQSTKFDITMADFKLFTVIWNQRMSQTTPQIHLKMADWLEFQWQQKNTRLLLMAFRSAGKSTITGLFAAWLLYRNPDLRILVLAADLSLAKKMVRNVKRILERHPLTRKLRPDNPDQWASDRFTVKRMIELRDPSMLAKGITANITGSRADIIICDDVEVPNTCDSPEKRKELRERLGEMEYVLVPSGSQLYVGTPHTYNTIYADVPRAELGENHAFLDGFKRLEIPVLDDKGQSAWIERYSEADIARMKRASGPNKFASQMMLQPVNIADGRLNPKLLRLYDLDIDYVKALRALFLSPHPHPAPLAGGACEDGSCLNSNPQGSYEDRPFFTPEGGEGGGDGCVKLISASAFWDPAFGSAKGDHSVMAITYSDDAGNIYLHHIEYIKICPPASSLQHHGTLSQEPHPRSFSLHPREGGDQTDEATQQCRIVAGLAKAHHLPSLTLETNGIGKFLPSILRNTLAHMRVPCRVQEVSQTRNKELRILEAFDAILAARRLHVHRDVLKTPFITEMQEWRPEGGKGHDDGLDAVAGALAQTPDRLPRIFGKGGHSWMQTTKTHKADTEFKV